MDVAPYLCVWVCVSEPVFVSKINGPYYSVLLNFISSVSLQDIEWICCLCVCVCVFIYSVKLLPEVTRCLNCLPELLNHPGSSHSFTPTANDHDTFTVKWLCWANWKKKSGSSAAHTTCRCTVKGRVPGVGVSWRLLQVCCTLLTPWRKQCKQWWFATKVIISILKICILY